MCVCIYYSDDDSDNESKSNSENEDKDKVALKDQDFFTRLNVSLQSFHTGRLLFGTIELFNCVAVIVSCKIDGQPGLKVIKLEFILRLKIKRNDWLLRTYVRKQPITALYFESHVSASSQSLRFTLSETGASEAYDRDYASFISS